MVAIPRHTGSVFLLLGCPQLDQLTWTTPFLPASLHVTRRKAMGDYLWSLHQSALLATYLTVIPNFITMVTPNSLSSLTTVPFIHTLIATTRPADWVCPATLVVAAIKQANHHRALTLIVDHWVKMSLQALIFFQVACPAALQCLPYVVNNLRA